MMLLSMVLVSLSVGILSTSLFIYPVSPNEEELTEDDLIVEKIKIDYIFIINWVTYLITAISLIAMIILTNEIGFKYSLVFSVMLLLAVLDFRFKLVPDTPIAIAAIISILIISDTNDFNLFVSRLVLAICVIVVLVLLAYLTDGKIGGGDIKIFAMLALSLGGDKLFLAFYLTFLIGTIVMLPFYLFKKIKVFALVPYITLSYFIVLLFGDDIIFWYLSGGFTRLLD